ncbi:hypothetical protein TNCV_3283571 [Trichonephila clavipes]|nr:hypothetical protein TNCV_3283571 [Trichonephila clavipes]
MRALRRTLKAIQMHQRLYVFSVVTNATCLTMKIIGRPLRLRLENPDIICHARQIASSTNHSYTSSFGDSTHNFEQWSSDEDDTGADTTSPNFPTTPTGGRLISDRFNVHQPLYTAGLQGSYVRTHDTPGASPLLSLTTRLHRIHIVSCI